ncbi:hypothetical protein ACFL4G_06740 [Thermodesulfobacteriota bacterium]
MSYKITIEDRGIYCVFSGALTNEELINCNNEIFQIPQFSEIEYEIVNFKNVTEFPIESSAIRTVAEQDAEIYKTNPNVKAAIVANTPVIKGLTNMYRTYFELSGNDISWEIEVFNTDEDARKWINA